MVCAEVVPWRDSDADADADGAPLVLGGPDDGAELDDGSDDGAELAGAEPGADRDGDGRDEDGAGAEGTDDVLGATGCEWCRTTVSTAIPPAAAAAVAPAASATLVARLAAARRRATREVRRCGSAAGGATRDAGAGTGWPACAERYACSAASTPRSSSEEPGARAASSNPVTRSSVAWRPSRMSSLPSCEWRLRDQLTTHVPSARPRVCGATS